MKLKSKTTASDQHPTFDDVKRWYNEHLHPDVIDLNDEHVYKHVYHEARWCGIFQATQKGAQKFFERAKPNNITDIAALTSIYRPGPLAAKVDDIYVEAKADPSSVKYEHPLVKQCLEATYGCITGDAIIITENGDFSLKEIVDAYPTGGCQLPSFNEITKEIELDEIVAAVSTGVKDVLLIETEDGNIELTSDHKVFTSRGWVEAKDLSIDDDILMIQS